MSANHLALTHASDGADAYEADDSTHVIGDSLDMLSELDAYNRWIYSLVKPHLGQRVMEVGCGTGNITQLIAQNAERVVGVEPIARFVDAFHERMNGAGNAEIVRGILSDVPEPTEQTQWFDSVVSFNVVEHIEDHVAALQGMKQQIRPGGTVVVYVPAAPFAFGELDTALGHFRRYTQASLRSAMEEAGLEWVTGRYNNAVGVFGWWLNSRILKKTEVPGGQAHAFNRIVPIVRFLESIVRPPFGQSVMGVARRPLHDAQLATETSSYAQAA